MKITDNDLVSEYPSEIGGVERIYDMGNGWQLSAINSPVAHYYAYAWEFAVLKNNELDYSTPLTSDVVVTFSNQEANEFIAKAKEYFNSL